MVFPLNMVVFSLDQAESSAVPGGMAAGVVSMLAVFGTAPQLKTVKTAESRWNKHGWLENPPFEW